MLRRFAVTIGLLFCITASSSEQSNAQRRRRTSSTSSDDAVARRIAAQYWSKYLIKCGGSYFLFSDDRLFEFRDKPHFGFSGQALSPKPLTRAEVLNGVDPLPVEWEGSIGVSFDVCRMNTAYYSIGGVQTFWHGWGGWSSNSCFYNTKLTKAKGQWSYFQPKVITCDQLSKWGFVFIPEGVRGAAAERRAEFDATTRAMLADAPNLGIYMSQNPQFSMDYFRDMYSRAKAGRLYKTKLFPGGYYVFFDKDGQVFTGNTSDYKLPVRASEVFRQRNMAMREFAIGPNNSWIGIIDRYVGGERYEIVGENIPQTLSDSLQTLSPGDVWSQKEPSRPQILGKWRPRLIALGPNENWVLFYGQNRWSCNCSDDVRKALQSAVDNGYQLKQFIYTNDGEWLVLYGPRFFAHSENFPRAIIDKLNELHKNIVEFDQVVLAPNGSWLIGGKFRKSYDWEILQ